MKNVDSTTPSAEPPYDTDGLRVQARETVQKLKRDPVAVLKVALSERSRGNLFLAYELFRACPAAAVAAKPAEIQKLAVGMNDWCSVDCYASFVSGVAWREGVVDDEFIHRWTKSKDRWYRRAALVSTVPFNLTARGATAPKGEAPKTLAVCELLLDDRDDMVVKAMSWALRTLAAKDAASVKAFAKKHDAQLAARVKRELTNKLKTGLKNPKK